MLRWQDYNQFCFKMSAVRILRKNLDLEQSDTNFFVSDHGLDFISTCETEVGIKLNCDSSYDFKNALF